jgi:hypothetical protein
MSFGISLRLNPIKNLKCVGPVKTGPIAVERREV